MYCMYFIFKVSSVVPMFYQKTMTMNSTVFDNLFCIIVDQIQIIITIREDGDYFNNKKKVN